MTSRIIAVIENTKVAKFMTLAPKLVSHTQPFNPELFTKHLNHSIHELLPADPTIGIEPQRADEFWFPTLETCENLEELTGINKPAYEELVELK